jgi:hypothetical protein
MNSYKPVSCFFEAFTARAALDLVAWQPLLVLYFLSSSAPFIIKETHRRLITRSDDQPKAIIARESGETIYYDFACIIQFHLMKKKS